MDLTKIDQSFGTLDIETKLAFHRADYEGKRFVYQIPGEARLYHVCDRPAWYPDYIYRVAPPPQRDIQVPWHVFGPEVQWAARDKDGGVYVYIEKTPEIGNTMWLSIAECIQIDHLHLIGFDPGNKPWDQSLVRRPEGV